MERGVLDNRMEDHTKHQESMKKIYQRKIIGNKRRGKGGSVEIHAENIFVIGKKNQKIIPSSRSKNIGDNLPE